MRKEVDGLDEGAAGDASASENSLEVDAMNDGVGHGNAAAEEQGGPLEPDPDTQPEPAVDTDNNETDPIDDPSRIPDDALTR